MEKIKQVSAPEGFKAVECDSNTKCGKCFFFSNGRCIRRSNYEKPCFCSDKLREDKKNVYFVPENAIDAD